MPTHNRAHAVVLCGVDIIVVGKLALRLPAPWYDIIGMGWVVAAVLIVIVAIVLVPAGIEEPKVMVMRPHVSVPTIE